MNVFNRSMIAELVIGVMLCIACAHVLLSPAHRELRLARERAEQAATTVSAGLNPRKAGAVEQENTLRRAEMERRSFPARDEAALFGTIVGLAEAQGLRVDQFQPSESRADARITASETSATEPNVPATSGDTLITYSISLSGPYPGVVRFLDSLRRSATFCSTKSVRVFAGDAKESGTIRAELVTDFFALPAPGTPRQALLQASR